MNEHKSTQPCGCDTGANWTCEQHRVVPADIGACGSYYIDTDASGELSIKRHGQLFCGFCAGYLTPTDTYSCPRCGWKVDAK